MIFAGSKFIEFDHVSWDRIYGFGVFISSNEGTVWPEDIWVHDLTVRGGEMGIGIVAGRRIKIERNAIVERSSTPSTSNRIPTRPVAVASRMS